MISRESSGNASFWRRSVSCLQCKSSHSRTFNAEINIHFPGYEGLAKPTVWLFPEIRVCLKCGSAEFSIPQAELQKLADDQPNKDC